MKQRFHSLVLVGSGIVLGLLIAGGLHTLNTAAQTAGGCQTFPQTGHTLCGRFLSYWQGHGGLAQQGYPISEEFIETNDLNGKPYTVQYFERAVFELHPENAPPFDVLLSQLGTFSGHTKYPQGFAAHSGDSPFYENRTDAAGTLKSFYNAVNRKEYERAYGYYQGAPNPQPSLAPPFAQFTAGFSDTAAVSLTLGEAISNAGAGNIYSGIPVIVQARHTDNTLHTFAGCYVLHRVNAGISPNPADSLWSINSAFLHPAANDTPLTAALNQPCSR